MIEKLKKENVVKAAKIYYCGLSMQVPKGYWALREIINHLNKINVFVYKDAKKILGLVSFKIKHENEIYIDFICAVESGKGIGKKLMRYLAYFAYKNKVKYILSHVSTKDKKVMKFYESCGFKKYAQYYARKDFLLYRIKAKPKKIIIIFKGIW